MTLDPLRVAAANGTGERARQPQAFDVLGNATEQRTEHLRRELGRDAGSAEELGSGGGDRSSTVCDETRGPVVGNLVEAGHPPRGPPEETGTAHLGTDPGRRAF